MADAVAGGVGVLVVADMGLVPKYQKAAATRMIKTTTITVPFVSMRDHPFEMRPRRKAGPVVGRDQPQA